MLAGSFLALALVAQAFRFEALDVSGMARVSPALVADIFQMRRGEEYVSEDLRSRLATLNATGLFETVSVTLLPGAHDSRAARVLVSVREVGSPVPPAGMARYLIPSVIVKEHVVEFDPVPLDIGPSDFLQLWGRRSVPSPPWPRSVARSSAARRLTWIKGRRDSALKLAWTVDVLRSGLTRGRRPLTPRAVMDAIAAADAASTRLDPMRMRRSDHAYLAYYAMRRAEILVAIDPGFADAVLLQPLVFGGPAMRLLEVRARLDPGDSATSAALATAAVLKASILRTLSADALGLGFFQSFTIPPADRAALEAVLAENPTTRHVLRAFPVFRRARCLAAAWLGDTQVISDELHEPLGWNDPAAPGFLLVYARAVYNNSRSSLRLPGFLPRDCLAAAAVDVDGMARRGGPVPTGEAAEALALVLSESPREQDIASWLARGNEGFHAGYTRGLVALRMGRSREAVAALTAALAKRSDARARYLLAVARLMRSDLAGAEHEFELLRASR